MRGRKPTPTALLRLGGSREIEHRGNEPQYAPPHSDRPPPHMPKAGKREWKRVYPLLKKTGVMTEADRSALEAYCETWAEWVEACDCK